MLTCWCLNAAACEDEVMVTRAGETDPLDSGEEGGVRTEVDCPEEEDEDDEEQRLGSPGVE